MGCGVPGEMPIDQRFDDGCSLTFDSLPLTEPLNILGAPLLKLDLSSDKPVAFICARLCDVAPDGSSRRISYQILNITHHVSHENPELLIPDKNYVVSLKLNDCGYVVPAGHRLRVALSTSYWPLIWPASEQATLRLYTEKSCLILPIRKRRIEDHLVHFEPSVKGLSAPMTLLQAGKFIRTFHLDLLNRLLRKLYFY